MNIKALHRAMSRGLNEDDLRTICVYLSETPGCGDLSYDKLGGNGAAIKALSVIDYCHKRRTLSALIDTMHEGWAVVLGNDYATWQTWATKQDTQPNSMPNLLSKIGLGRMFAHTGSVKDLFAQLVRAEGEQDWNTVIQLGEQILMMDAKHQLARRKTAEAYELRGMGLISKGEYDAASNGFSRAIDLYPYADLYYNAGICCNRKTDYSNAVYFFSEAIKRGNNARYYYEHGLSYDGLGQYEKAAEDKTNAIKLDVNNPHYYFSRGESYRLYASIDVKSDYYYRDFRIDFLSRAIKDYSTAINLDPNEADYYYGREMAYKALNDNQVKSSKENAHRDFQYAADLGHSKASRQLANL